ncbi:PKD domain-containing protein [Candidatus Cloacimonadota bacterium]
MLEAWYETQDPSQVYLLATFDWSVNGVDLVFAAEMYDTYGDFGNGYVPFFAVIGPQNILYYGDNDVGGIYGPLEEAISDFALMANFAANSQTGPPALGIQFTSNATSPNGEVLTWEWDFDGDGEYDSTEENPYYTYTVPGVYDVTLRVTDSEGEAETTLTEYITVLEPSDVFGEITGVWSPTYGPYTITGDVLINSESILQIEPGTEVMVEEGFQIEINGNMNINAGWDEPVVLSSETSWAGLKFMDTTADVLIKGVEISNVLGTAFHIENSGCVHIEDSWIINNNCTSNVGTAFEIKYSGDIVLERNIIANNGNSSLTGGISVVGSNPLIRNNLIVNNGSPGALAGALSFKENSYPVVYNNTIANNISSGCTVFMFNSQADIMNCIISSDSYIFTTVGNLPNVSYTCISGGYNGVGNIDADPIFVNPSEGNGPEFNGYEAEWYLAAGSTCIDAGNPEAEYNDVEDPSNPGYALYPAMGMLTNDMGAFGGNGMFEYVGSEDELIDIDTFSSMKAYPNPFNPETNIALNLNADDAKYPVNLSIYNIKGQLVKTLITNSVVNTGTSIKWDGKDNNGSSISTGVYFVRLETASNFVSSKIVLMK